MVTIQRIGKSGRSLYTVIPKPMLKALGLRRGDTVAVALEDGRVVIKKVDERLLMQVAPRRASTTPSPPSGK